jgi:hypothetical protein
MADPLSAQYFEYPASQYVQSSELLDTALSITPEFEFLVQRRKMSVTYESQTCVAIVRRTVVSSFSLCKSPTNQGLPRKWEGKDFFRCDMPTEYFGQAIIEAALLQVL